MADESLRVTIAPEVVEALDGWSAPVRLRIENGELLACRAGHGVPDDDDRWPKKLPLRPLGTAATQPEGKKG